MLSDTSIQRDKNYSFPRRMLLKARKYASRFFRPALNEKIRRELEGIDFTILGNNCLAGVFYHDAGRRFTTPTINTGMDGEDFIKFLENPRHYLEADMTFITWEGHNYPIAHIDDIEVRFVHDTDPEVCQKKWRERGARIVWDNVYIVATDHDGLCQRQWLERFDRLPYKNKIVFTAGNYPEYDWAITVPQFKGRFQVRILTNFANFKGERYYETCFDIAKWIKEKSATGASDENI